VLRRTALLCSAALVVAGLSTGPAQAAAPTKKPTRIAGGLTEVLRGSVQPGKAALRRQAGSGTQPKLVAQSTWQVTYEGFGSNAPAQQAFQAAVDVWAGIVKSSVPIKVHAKFTPLGSGVLGQAGPDGFSADPSIGDGVSYYPDALADALANTDTFPQGDYDIDAEFNSTEPDIYYGTAGNPAANQIDFESVVLHELGHGLGITSAAVLNQHGTASDADDTAYFDGAPDRLIFDKYLFNASDQPLFKAGDTRDILRSFLNTTLTGDTDPTNKVFFRGAQALNQNYGVKPTLYAPNPFLEGSSIAHLDEWTYPTGNADSLMTPYLQNDEVVHAPGPLTKAVLRDLGWQTTADLPGKVKNVVATKHTNSITLSWQAAPAGGAAVTNHTVTYTVNGGAPISVPTASAATTYTLPTTGHTDSYVLSVAATNSAGTGPSSDAVGPVVATDDSTAPTLAFNGSQPSGVIQTTTAAFSLTGDDGAGTPSGSLVYKCKLDSGTYTTCSSTPTFTNLSNATHNLSFVVLDEANNVSNVLTASFRVDTLPPVVTAVPPSIFTTDTLIGMRYSATDPSGISRYDVRYRRAQFNQTLGSYAIFAANTTATVARLNAPAGYTYCFSVRAYDKLNKVSPWSVDRCVATTLDDRALAASTGWTRGTGSPYYAKTITSTSQLGRTLTRTSVQARRIALVATTCSTCGTVGVYFNGALIKTISLKASTTTYKRIIAVVDFGVARGGTLVVKTLNTGRTYIDGVAFNRA
jgi:hypothetical protein